MSDTIKGKEKGTAEGAHKVTFLLSEKSREAAQPPLSAPEFRGPSRLKSGLVALTRLLQGAQPHLACGLSAYRDPQVPVQ